MTIRARNPPETFKRRVSGEYAIEHSRAPRRWDRLASSTSVIYDNPSQEIPLLPPRSPASLKMQAYVGPPELRRVVVRRQSGRGHGLLLKAAGSGVVVIVPTRRGMPTAQIEGVGFEEEGARLVGVSGVPSPGTGRSFTGKGLGRQTSHEHAWRRWFNRSRSTSNKRWIRQALPYFFVTSGLTPQPEYLMRSVLRINRARTVPGADFAPRFPLYYSQSPSPHSLQEGYPFWHHRKCG